MLLFLTYCKNIVVRKTNKQKHHQFPTLHAEIATQRQADTLLHNMDTLSSVIGWDKVSLFCIATDYI